MESSVADRAQGGPFHTVTPTLESWALSQVAGVTVFLKCENMQPTGSFKIRGIGHFCQEMAKKGCRHLVCASGLGPGQSEGARVGQERQLGERLPVRPPLDMVREGHASLVRELKAALGTPPGALVLAVGGGGLLAGVVAGLVEVGWQHVPIIAMETRGAHSFNAAVKAGRLVTLPDITSVAKCLGAKTVAARALECTQECRILSEVVEDAEAVSAVQRFLDDERMLVQPACGAALAAVYSGLLGRLQAEGHLQPGLTSVVVIVCGGSGIDSRGLQALKTQLGLP
nr:serine dehydratase-like isoform X2 [Microcebus murinus]